MTATSRLSEPSLLYVPGATAGTTQWRAALLQVVNWGGFEGRVRIPIHPDSTLLSGSSGTGKSTLLDAYTALMMDANTPFNGASNDAVSGRARSAEQRNLLSYLRGQTGTATDERSGRTTAKTLRGSRSATWGAVSMTFVNDHGAQFTALRAYYVPVTATESRSVLTRMATYPGELDLADLAEHLESRFAPAALKTAWPGLDVHDSYQKFATALFTKLSIGSHGNGGKALKMLTRIQAGHPIQTVDTLYKDLVLETPATYEHADRALGHFDDLENAYTALVTEQQKAQLLDPITDHWNARESARVEAVALDQFGLHTSGPSPVTLWSLQTERRLLDAAADLNRLARITAGDSLRHAREHAAAVTTELAAARDAHSRAGGSDLNQLQARIAALEVELEARRGARAALQSKITALATPLTDHATFTQLTADGAAFLETVDEQQHRLKTTWKDISGQTWQLDNEARLLREERASYAGRAGRVDPGLNAARDQMASAAGLRPDELPFIAELIDVAPEHEQWRSAAEAVLAGAARTVLVPLDRLEEFSARIDAQQLSRRVTFQGVAAQPHRSDLGAHDDPDVLVGKLTFKESVYSSWVHAHLSEPARNARCITDPAQLAGGGLRVLPSGQTRTGRTRGSHGRSADRRIIGFSNAGALAEIDERLAAVAAERQPLEEQLEALSTRERELKRLELAYRDLANYSWAQIDTDSPASAIEDARSRIDAILSSDDVLRALAEQVAHLEREDKAATVAAVDRERECERLLNEQGRLVDRQDRVTDKLESLERHTGIELSEEQSDRLDTEFAAAAAPDDPEDLDRFNDNLGRLHTRLSEGLKRAHEQVAVRTAAIEQVFRAYQGRWEDPNLGQGIESYQDYARILAAIHGTGLHERREAWRTRLARWSGEDLVPLAQAMGNAVNEIEERMEPVNTILSTLSFGPNGDRLSMHMRRLSPEHVTKFRKQLNALSGTATRGVEDSDMDQRFRHLQTFMSQLRKPTDPRYVKDRSDRDRLLDVRRHVEITAEQTTTSGEHVAVLRAIGGKSGGESQELVAFIVGAALRFRLGDEENARPTFAPVFLDEGFVKSDAKFTGRAVQAWKGLGFQLIVGAPLEKVSGLEPHMDLFLVITKNEKSGYSFANVVTDRAPRPAATSPGAAVAEAAE